MKIGILTYHRSHNYGALLQAVALRYELTKLGNDVYFVDYWPKYHQRMYAYFSFYNLTHRRIRGAFFYLYEFIKYHNQKKKKIANFNFFMDKFITPYCNGMDDTYDMIVHGSDQIWRKQNGKVYNPVYFGLHSNIMAKYNVSYAASMGEISKDNNDIQVIKKYLSHLDKISVRESDLLDFVHKLGFKNATISLDPALLLTKDEWNSLIPNKTLNIKKKYLLYYKLLNNSFNDSDIYAFAKTKGWDVQVLYGCATTRRECDNFICTAGPIEFINLIRSAEFVITSSFHGVVFSLIFQKPFYAAFSIGGGRAKSILEKLDLEKLLLKPMSPIPFTYSGIDYLDISEKIQNLSKDSIKYLNDLNNILM